MSITTCSRCDRYVDTDDEEMEVIEGEEVCENCLTDDDAQ